VTYEPGSRELLVKGAHVILFGTEAEDGKSRRPGSRWQEWPCPPM